MGRVVLRSDLAVRARRHAGQENVGFSANRLFISDAELNVMLDDAARELDDVLVASRGHDYAAVTAQLSTLTTVDGQSGYDLPADFFELLSVRLNEGGAWRELERFAPSQVSEIRNSSARGLSEAMRYRLGGTRPDDADPNQRDRLVIEPVPTVRPTVEIEYVPLLTFVTDSNAVAYVGVNGWESYIVYSAVADMHAKAEELDLAARWDGKKQAVKARIARLASRRDRSKPVSIVCKPLGRARFGRGLGYPYAR